MTYYEDGKNNMAAARARRMESDRGNISSWERVTLNYGERDEMAP